MAPRVLAHPGARTTEGIQTVDKDILAPSEHLVSADEQEYPEQSTSCLYCLEGWVFLGSLGHDGEEIVEAIRCRCCGGTGRMTREGQSLRQ
jgi:hypothetical protein